MHNYLIMSTCDPLKYIIDNPIHIVFICMGISIRIQRVKWALPVKKFRKPA